MKKRSKNTFSIKDLMDAVIKENRLEKGLKKVNISEAWMKLMGAGVANNTREIKLQNGTLIIALNSSVLREELSHGKVKIMKMLNDEMGENLIKRLMLV